MLTIELQIVIPHLTTLSDSVSLSLRNCCSLKKQLLGKWSY
jgi:hypothetical protein